MVIDEIQKEFTDHVIPFWMNLRDDEFGGYYGLLDYNLELNKKAVKGCILNSRILWFFANAYMCFKDEKYIEYASHAFDFMKRYCIDREKCGVYWSVTYDGKIEDSTKHTYNQAFAIYALSSYFDASGDREALDIAYGLFDVIETKCRDKDGYLEAFTRDFQPESNEKLSENGVEATRTMNTLLHVFEAYTELYRVDKNTEVAIRLKEMLDIFADRVYNPELGRLEVFFDRDYRSLIDLYSYGHDIETAWLIDRGLEVLEDDEYCEKIYPITKKLTSQIFKVAFDGNSMPAECCKGIVEESRVWWVQAEAMVGFYNGYQHNQNLVEYKNAVISLWSFVKNNIIDKREGSEWFWEVDKNGVPFSKKPIVEPWKCPYHTGRMCFELIKRKADI